MLLKVFVTQFSMYANFALVRVFILTKNNNLYSKQLFKIKNKEKKQDEVSKQKKFKYKNINVITYISFVRDVL